ncbi:MAG: DUF308 domain-containing protein [Mangrovicoccus sp.]|nr:DUF308 domain-containing protein [Mangrovicoccus sp.]
MKLWLKWMILGVLSLVFGGFVLAHPVAASIAVTTLAGILFMVSGGFQAFVALDEHTTRGKVLSLALAVLLMLLGGSLAFNPLQGMISLALVVTILFAANGLMRLVLSWQMRETPFFWPMLISGAFSVLLAGFIAANFFEVAPQLLGILLGIELLFNGVGLIVLALFIRRHGEAILTKLKNKTGG